VADFLKELAKDYGPYISAGTVFISAAVAFTVAAITIKTNRSIARKKATLDLIVMSETNPQFQEMFKQFIILRDESKDGIFSIAPVLRKLFEVHHAKGALKLRDHLSNKKIETFKNLQNCLNYYELIAVGIDNKILDEKFYREWKKRMFVNAWNDSQRFIFLYRRLANYGNFFCRFEHYAKKWQLSPWKRFFMWFKGERIESGSY
jgi:hypothetical protein